MPFYKSFDDNRRKKPSDRFSAEEEGSRYRTREGVRKKAASDTKKSGANPKRPLRSEQGKPHRDRPMHTEAKREQEPAARTYREYEYRPRPAAAEQQTNPEKEESFILTGRNPIREALKNGRDLEKLLVQKGDLSGSAMEIVQKAKERRIMVQVVDKERLDEIAPRHQGLIAVASAYSYATVEDILQTARDRNEDPFIIILDGITDPHNLGAIIRTAECCGAHGVIVPQHRSVGLTPSAVKSSAGAVEYLKVARVTNLNRTIEQLQSCNIWVYAVTMNGTDYMETDFRGGTALVIGAEGEGISRLTEEKCDQAVSLPMKGHLDSLNASVAAGIMMYRVMNARRSAR